jgi:hypothetical protein
MALWADVVGADRGRPTGRHDISDLPTDQSGLRVRLDAHAEQFRGITLSAKASIAKAIAALCRINH